MIAGRWLLLGAAMLAGVALAAPPDLSGTFSIVMPSPYAKVVDAVREVCADGVIRGTAQYEAENVLAGAVEGGSAAAFGRSSGAGEAFFKSRPKAVAPANFASSKDQGTVTVRYTVEPGPGDSARLTIDAVFVEDTHHGRHASKGFVERAEFGAVAKLLKASATAASPAGGGAGQPVAAGNPPAGTRVFPFAAHDLQAALTTLGAFDDAALPMLEGFAVLNAEELARVDRPRYRFNAQFEPGAAGSTLVRLTARITARYSDPASERIEYRAIPSNGRLESDLIDRLQTYMNSRKTATGPEDSSARPNIMGLIGK